jgi:hypothetical protein
MEQTVNPLLAKMDARRREMMTKLEASHAKFMAKMKAIDARRLKMEADRRERLANMEATLKRSHEEWIKTFMRAELVSSV